MLSSQEKIRHLKMSLTCLRQKGEKRDIFSPDVPSEVEIELIKNALNSGDVDESLLKKFFPMAYEGVSEYGFFKYFFLVHNKKIRSLERYTKDTSLVDWCTAYPAIIENSQCSKWVVRTISGRTVLTDSEVYPGITVEKNLKVGDMIVLHRDKIHMLLNEDEYEMASKFYNEFENEVKI